MDFNKKLFWNLLALLLLAIAIIMSFQEIGVEQFL